MQVTAAATFCATVVDELVRGGVRHAVVCPGSRSTPLALALAGDGRLAVHVHHDERAAGFLALGIGARSGHPAVVVTTSGTAAVELHPAVVEASQAAVPLVACTADRPPELHHVGAPQTVDQQHLYGRAVRWFCDPGVPDEAGRATWRSLGARAVVEALGPPAGPVHLNLAFRDPLVGVPGELPAGRPGEQPWHGGAAGVGVPDAAQVAEVAAILAAPRGVVVAGGGAGDPGAVRRLAEHLGWPVLADPRSGCRVPGPTTVTTFDALLRHHRFAAEQRPDVVLRLGAPPASRALAGWMASSGATQVALDPNGQWWDPDRTAQVVRRGDPAAWCSALMATVPAAPRTPWLTRWAQAEALAQATLTEVLAAEPAATEPGVARTVAAACPAGTTLVVSSSMPIRDLEWYAAPRHGLRVLANRGANGIDGVVSTAVGVALAGDGPTVALVGDVAFLHDANALLGAVRRSLDLTVVVVDNDGGGIFSFLPQATAVDPQVFERLFGTPHGVDPCAVAAALGVPGVEVSEAVTLLPALGAAVEAGGARVVRVRTGDRAANVATHDRLHAAVRRALDAR